MVNLKQLQCFLRVSELQSFTVAAERMNMAQSALSRQVMNLEASLGVALIDRSSRRLRLTRAGEMLQARARHLLQLAEDIEREIVSQSTSPSGKVVVGALPSFSNYIFPVLTDGYRRLFPDVRLQLVVDLTEELQHMLRRDQIDIAVLAFPEPDPKMDMVFLCREDLYLVSATRLDPGFGEACEFTDIAGLPLALTSMPSKERLWFERLAIMKGLRLNTVVETNSLLVLKDLARKGMGHLMVPHSAIWNERDDPALRLTRIKDASVERLLARRADRIPSPAQAKMWDFICRQVDRERGQGMMS